MAEQMTTWCPKTPLEREIALQDNYNFIYGELNDQELRRQAYQSRPSDHLDYLNKRVAANNNTKDMPGCSSLSTIRAVHRIAGTKQMGMNASLEDWNTSDNVAKETIAMMRHFGIGPSVDRPLNKDMTLPTLPYEERKYITQNGQILFPVLLADDDFKVVSTRMRNAESAKKILDDLNGSTDVSKTDFDIKPLLCEEKPMETIDEFKERKTNEFLEEYPSLKQQQQRKTTKNKKANSEVENWRTREPENWRDQYKTDTVNFENNWRAEISQLTSNLNNSSISSGSSSYASLNTTTSDEYVSAKEFLDNSFESVQKQQHNSHSYAKVVQHSELPKGRLRKQINKNLNGNVYSPKALYKLKKQCN